MVHATPNGNFQYGNFAFHLHKPSTNRFLHVNGKQPVLFFVFEFSAFSLNCCSSFASQSGNPVRHCFKIRNNHFSVTMETGVIFICKYFKFGLNTTCLSQSHFRNFLACSIMNVTEALPRKNRESFHIF